MKETKLVRPSGNFMQYVIEIERDLATTIAPELEDLRKLHGDRISNEILLSVCALLSARAVCMVNIWSGEDESKILPRLVDAIKTNVTPTKKKLIEHFAKAEATNA